MATPTPLVYTLREGDTLSEIALRYGLSVETLLRANPGLNPRALPVGATLQIPQAGQVLGLLATPTPAAEIRLRGPWCFATALAAVCTLAVVNPTAQPLAAVSVALQVYDPTWPEPRPWQTIVQPWLWLVPAHDEMPMAVHLPRPLGPQAGVLALLLSALPAEQGTDASVPWPAEVQGMVQETGLWEGTVRVRPPTETASSAGGGRAVIALYDDAQRVVGLRYTPVSATGEQRVFVYLLTSVPAVQARAWAEADTNP